MMKKRSSSTQARELQGLLTTEHSHPTEMQCSPMRSCPKAAGHDASRAGSRGPQEHSCELRAAQHCLSMQLQHEWGFTLTYISPSAAASIAGSRHTEREGLNAPAQN